MNEFTLEDSLAAWEANAQFWDEYMGDESNKYHRETVRPVVDELLGPKSGELILDAACGNGNYSAHLAKYGARVIAFDYSHNMIELAKKRRSDFMDRIEFYIADAANLNSILSLGRERTFDKAVSNMALMDICNPQPLFQAVYELLKSGGIFVFSTQHPCFVTLTDMYMTPHGYYGEAILGQPQKQCYYHRSIQDIFKLCFDAGFVIDGFLESCYNNPERPEVIAIRAKKS